MLVPRTLTVKMTVKVCEAATSALRFNSLEGSLMIEWVAWSAQYVLYITERMASFPHRTYAAEGEEVALLRSHPDYLRLSDSVEDQLWPSMSKTLTLMIGLLLAFVVGWLGAF